MAKKSPADNFLQLTICDVSTDATLTPQQAIAEIGTTAATLSAKNILSDASNEALILALSAGVDFFENDERNDATRAVFTDLYHIIAPYVSFSADFTGHVTKSVKKWAEQCELDQLMWGLHLQYGNADPLSYLESESDALDALLDPKKLAYTLSDAYYKRGTDYCAVNYDTLDIDPAATKEQGMENIKKANVHTRKMGYYNRHTDTVSFNRARFNQNVTTFHAGGKSAKDSDDLIDFLQNNQFAGDVEADYFYMTSLAKAPVVKEVLAHEKIHQDHERRYVAAILHPQKRCALHFSYYDQLLTTASTVCLSPENAHRRRHNKIETFTLDVLQAAGFGTSKKTTSGPT